ncbi:MAG TPA: RDD family protein [Dongiaceae bacterium]|nr:RDD family protein [Dongiaceae bacterium]
MRDNLPTIIDLSPTGEGSPLADPLTAPALYEGVVLRRCVAFFIDWFVLLCLFVLGHLATCTTAVFTFGTLTPLAIFIVSLLPIIYGTWAIGGRASATPGMRCMDLTVRSWLGRRPDYLQALLMTVLFYVTAVPFGGLLLLYVLFDRRLRCIHDHLSGVIVLRRQALADYRGA